jgi:hypothetical protein
MYVSENMNGKKRAHMGTYQAFRVGVHIFTHKIRLPFGRVLVFNNLRAKKRNLGAKFEIKILKMNKDDAKHLGSRDMWTRLDKIRKEAYQETARLTNQMIVDMAMNEFAKKYLRPDED